MATRILIPTTAWIVAIVGVLRVPSNLHRADAFVSNHRSPRTPTMTANLGSERRTAPSILWYANSPDTISEKTASELRKELESYGVSTSSMFERREFEDALTKAKVMETEKEEVHSTGKAQKSTASSDIREETDQEESKNEDSSKTTQEKWSTKWENVASAAKEAFGKYAAGSSGDSSAGKPYLSDNQGSNFSSSSPSASTPSPTPSPTKSMTRRERYENALDEGRSMRISSLKQELKDRGISSNSFFEKSDLVKAYANSIADGIKTKDSKRHNTSRHSEQNSFDPSYRKVIMHAFDPSTLMAGDIVIDITENTEWAQPA